jgi:hypothetical protein
MRNEWIDWHLDSTKHSRPKDWAVKRESAARGELLFDQPTVRRMWQVWQDCRDLGQQGRGLERGPRTGESLSSLHEELRRLFWMHSRAMIGAAWTMVSSEPLVPDPAPDLCIHCQRRVENPGSWIGDTPIHLWCCGELYRQEALAKLECA